MERRSFLRTSAAATGAAALGSLATSAAWAAPGPKRKGPLRVQILMFEGVEVQDFAGPLEVLGLVQSGGGPMRVTLVKPGAPGQVVCALGLKVDVATTWNPTAADVLVVPGGGGLDNRPGINTLIKDKQVLANVVRAYKAGVIMTGVCSGVMLLSAAGLTRGRPCTTHSASKAALAAQGGKVVNARVVDDGDLITSGGITSGLDLGLWLVTRELGADISIQVEAAMEYEQRGVVWRRS
ncbi:DJ-1/PfpI family protein [Nonomuraea mesophila]|uniref:DJ-1/PfpI family protein n=1 Tax=Nonomuraea mesophila TaxID=2530382 RepID=A0A4R5FJ50_9ACTN|nr:DJ-1/PfpI family protein [Nonomuraea mesophila]TDE52811.1 DJ-1/PfpI family protein [Nonomuraea mesophila]